MLFGKDGAVLARVQRPFAQHFPRDGWVEHDAEEIWRSTLACAREAMAGAGTGANAVAGIGVAVQRETVVVWERASGRPIHHAIVWQDRRTTDVCRSLAFDPSAVALVARTGLLLDPYFSATKIAWILDAVPGARSAAARGELLAGTIDSWLLWRLTGGAVHATDATNASRTLLFDLHEQRWSPELCELFRVPMGMLPEVRDSGSDFGETAAGLFDGPIVVRALLGDQQAAAFGQECVTAGACKATFGTGCFVLVHTGDVPRTSEHRLLTTVALRLNGRVTYAMEGSIFNSGTVVQWLRDRVGLIATADETASIAASVASSGGVFLVPAFTGLGAPWWDPEARGTMSGLTRDSGRAEIVRAALESVSLQLRDLAEAFARDGVPMRDVRVDGGMAANDWLMQTLSDQLDLPVERPVVLETTAWGVARLAGMQASLYPAPGAPGSSALRQVNRTFTPSGERGAIDALHAGWLGAIARTRSAAGDQRSSGAGVNQSGTP
ncbi:MAG: glycerol kinase [Gemmatimonadaceae bacterium]|nr:glycerol kinase [Gemmatimonadaceae bacterium]